MTDFFISYTQADREWAEWIAWVLEEAGYQAVIQAWDFQSGSNFVEEMNKATIKGKRTLAVLSPDYFQSRFATAEWTAAFRDRKLLTVRVQDMDVEGILGPIVYIDLVGLNEATARERLVREVVPGRRKPLERPRFPGRSAPHFPGAAPAVAPEVEHGSFLLEKLPLDKVPDPAPLPPGSRMPHAVNPMFVGRDEDLRELARALKAGESAAIGQIAAATGMGGIGKTQLASELVHRYGQFFEGGVFWMSFADSAGVPAEVAACGRNLGLHPQFDELPLERQAQLVRDSWQDSLPRLLVFDNCEEPDLLQQWRPTTGRSRVLLTSRRARWDPMFGIRSYALETLARPASIQLLRRFRPDLSESDPSLEAISQELGDLPLALHLAGNFLQRYRHSSVGQPKAYLEELRRGDLLSHPSLQGERAGLIPTSHEAHVARTFALSYERLDSEDRVDALAQRMLARASYFAPGEPIPRGLLLATLGLADDSSAGLTAEEALGWLIDLGLLEEGDDGRVVMHRLVAWFAKATGQESEDLYSVEATLAEEAHRLNEAGFPNVLLGWQSHLRFVVDSAFKREDTTTAWLCNELGFHLKEMGDLWGARPHYERALTILEEVLGPEDPNTAGILSNLGSLLHGLGDFSEAQTCYERALAILEKVLGPEDVKTAISLNNLGGLFQNLGKLLEAQAYFERALAIREKVLGPEHPKTAVSLNNLGVLLRQLGDLSGAQPYLERALAIRERVLGPEHPDTATSLHNLGSLLQALGDLSRARQYYERALAIREMALGPEHPDTAKSLDNLGSLLQALGDLLGARPYLQRAFAILEKVLGPEHLVYCVKQLDFLVSSEPVSPSPGCRRRILSR
jgi:tetratricopeptide (TPR) repeat protein